MSGAHPRIVPGRGRYAGQAFVLHGCISDGPFTYAVARDWLQDLIRHPIAPEVYADFEARGLGGRATHFLTADGTDIDMGKVNVALAARSQPGDGEC